MPEEEKIVRRWVRWTIITVWLVTAVAVAILCQTHTSAIATVTMHVREIHFRTDPWGMLDAADQKQFTIAGPARLSIAAAATGDARSGAGRPKEVAVDAPTAASSCSFYLVRTGPLSLAKDSGIALPWPKNADADSFSIRIQEPVSGSINTRHSGDNTSSFLCSGIYVSGNASDTIEGDLSESSNSSFATRGDAQLSYHEVSSGSLEGNVRVTGEIRVGHVDPADAGEETSALVEALPGEKNEIVFDDFSPPIALNTSDLIEIVPGRDLYLRRLKVKNGIETEFHGTVRELRVGAGTRNFRSRMPSLSRCT